MFDSLESFAKYVIDIDEFRVAHVSHPMVADEHDVKDVGKIASLNGVMQVPREDVHLFQDFL